ncbi:DUF5638 domain-containing protein [Legionella sp. WA2024007413]
MPFNHTKLERRLKACNKKLRALFADVEDVKLQHQVNAVNDYYNLSYTKATSAQRVEQIAASYESFVDRLTNVKNGELNPKEAAEQVGSACESRKIGVLFHNLAKACEFMFYAATAFSLYAGIFGIALPVLIVQPVLGVAVGITIVGAMLGAIYKAGNCLTELRSLSRHDTEYTNEISLVSFFKPKHQEKALYQTEKEELDTSCCFSAVSN